MASMKIALASSMDAVVGTFNAAIVTISVVEDAAHILKSYSKDMLHERQLESAAGAELLQTQVIDNAAKAVVNHQLQTVQWIGGDTVKSAMFDASRTAILARLS